MADQQHTKLRPRVLSFSSNVKVFEKKTINQLFNVKAITDNVLQISENYYDSWNKANMYLFRENGESILVDTGTGVFDPVKFLLEHRFINKKPKVGIATHVHYDHSGGNKYFENFAIHALEARHLQEAYENQMFPFIAKNELLFTPSNSHSSGNYEYHVDKRSKELPLQCLNNGDRFYFGTDGDNAESHLEVIHLPGHTPGSIGILYSKEKMLCTGDMLFDSFPMLDHYPGQGSRHDFKVSMEKIIDMINNGKIEFCLPGHGPMFHKNKALEMASRYIEFANLRPHFPCYF